MAVTVVDASLGTRFNTITSAASYSGFVTEVAVAAGDFIVLAVASYHAAVALTSVTDDSGSPLTWTIDKQGQAGAPGAPNVAIVSAQAPSGLPSGTTITVNFGAAVDVVTVGGMVLRGVATSSPVDTTVGPVGVSPSSVDWTTGSMTVLAGSVLVGLVFGETSATTNAADTGSTEAWDEPAPDGWTVALEYRIEASAGSYSVDGTFSAAQASTTVGVAYLEAAGGGGGVAGQGPPYEFNWT